MTLSRRVMMSFTVFAMFFGAGNLIFPVFLAFQAGENVIPAFLGFAISAIGLPVLALQAVTRTGSLGTLADRVHPLFSRIFTIVIYLAIGPCLAIPRTASTSCEMVLLAMGSSSRTVTFIYCTVFFAAAGLMARKPEKLSKRLGKFLSPLLILLILVLLTGTLSAGSLESTPVQGSYVHSPFSEGFLEGYQTMDAIAGLVFGSILALNISKAEAGQNVKRECVIASIAGGFLILAVYTGLALIGLSSHRFLASAANGAEILSAAASAVFPGFGRCLIALIFIIACFNTCTGLLSSCGEYFSRIVPSVSRDKWIALFCLVSLVLANAGLDQMISLSAPVLELIYPVAVTLMTLAFIPHQSGLKAAYVLSAASALIFSAAALITGKSFIWIPPVIIAAAAGFITGRKRS